MFEKRKTHLTGLEVKSIVIGVASNLEFRTIGSCPASCQTQCDEARRAEYEMQPLLAGHTGLDGQAVFWRAMWEPRESVADAILTT